MKIPGQGHDQGKIDTLLKPNIESIILFFFVVIWQFFLSKISLIKSPTSIIQGQCDS